MNEADTHSRRKKAHIYWQLGRMDRAAPHRLCDGQLLVDMKISHIEQITASFCRIIVYMGDNVPGHTVSTRELLFRWPVKTLSGSTIT